eukprot:1148924-Pelagomonas_calceolata.AAC.4
MASMLSKSLSAMIAALHAHLNHPPVFCAIFTERHNMCKTTKVDIKSALMLSSQMLMLQQMSATRAQAHIPWDLTSGNGEGRCGGGDCRLALHDAQELREASLQNEEEWWSWNLAQPVHKNNGVRFVFHDAQELGEAGLRTRTLVFA